MCPRAAPSRPCSEVFNPAHDLTISGLSFQGDHFSLFLSTLSRIGVVKGAFVHVACTNTLFCPFTSMLRYLGSRGVYGPEDPLFVTGSRKVVTGSWFASRLRVAVGRCGAGLRPSYAPLVPDRGCYDGCIFCPRWHTAGQRWWMYWKILHYGHTSTSLSGT